LPGSSIIFTERHEITCLLCRQSARTRPEFLILKNAVPDNKYDAF
jgi:hypothetical protein